MKKNYKIKGVKPQRLVRVNSGTWDFIEKLYNGERLQSSAIHQDPLSRLKQSGLITKDAKNLWTLTEKGRIAYENQGVYDPEFVLQQTMPQEQGLSSEETQGLKSAIVLFPNIKVDQEKLAEYEEYPRTRFKVTYNSDLEQYVTYYSEADQHIEGITIEEVAKNIQLFLESDEVIDEVGNYVIQSVFKQKKISLITLQKVVSNLLAKGWSKKKVETYLLKRAAGNEVVITITAIVDEEMESVDIVSIQKTTNRGTDDVKNNVVELLAKEFIPYTL